MNYLLIGKKCQKNGTTVHWAENYEDVNKIIYKMQKKIKSRMSLNQVNAD